MARQANITNWDEVPEIFDIPMFARLFGSSREYVQRQCKRGEVPAFRHGKLYLFEKETVREYIRQNSVVKVGAEQQGAI